MLKELTEKLDKRLLPRHVAVIMDGNGRWARTRGLDRSAGHVEGVNTVRRITETASNLGIKYLTLYTFSTENWNRPQAEVDMLMELIAVAIERETPDLIRNNVRLQVIGDMERLPTQALARLQRCMELTAADTGLTLILAISYSARWEITRAARLLAARAAAGELDPAAIDDEMIAASLSTAGYPDPDLLIRTGGDFRVSNFLLWQIAYAEIIVTDTFWPEYSDEEFVSHLIKYQSRERRFGLTSDQLASSATPDVSSTDKVNSSSCD